MGKAGKDMMMKRARKLLVPCIWILCLLLSSQAMGERGHREDNVYRVYDEEENYIFSTAMGVVPGDRYINEANNEYLVIGVEERQGLAKFLGTIDLLDYDEEEDTRDSASATLSPVLIPEEGMVGIFHTHTAESYLPPDAFTEGYGDIYEVGHRFAEAISAQGIQARQSWANHLPHDGAAYDRSRRTVKELMEEGVDVLLDVHRDGVPNREEYIANVDGQLMSQVRLVVGRQNPTMGIIEELARRIKATADEDYPGLIKGIFFANGHYNQDLSPQSMLLEFGTHVTTKEEAIRSTAPFADVVVQVFFGAQAGATSRGASRAGIQWLFFLLISLVLGVLIYLFITEKNWSGVKKRLKQFFTQEWKDLKHPFKWPLKGKDDS